MYSIEAREISKTFRLYRKPSDRLKEALLRRSFHQSFECLKDISFSVAAGNSFGVIGENGAGKSTLLKILAGTLTPNSGEIVARGRVAALLELGAGFYYEFTGRQNIYLNASLLGLSKAEIKEREPAIIDFAELGQFIDRPIKTYSSGMVMRLAFSIATSVDPEILIIDEALSVGDQRFQQKCVERMAAFRDMGKTIVFCTHSMYLINELCTEAIWLNKGRICSHGKTSRVISDYMAYLEKKGGEPNASNKDAPPESSPLPEIMIEYLRLLDGKGRLCARVKQFQPVVFQVRTRCTGPPLKGHLAVVIERQDGLHIFGASTKNSGKQPILFSAEQTAELAIPSVPMFGGSFCATAIVSDEHTLRAIHQFSITFSVESDHPEYGLFWMEHSWRFSGDAEEPK